MDRVQALLMCALALGCLFVSESPLRQTSSAPPAPPQGPVQATTARRSPRPMPPPRASVSPEANVQAQALPPEQVDRFEDGWAVLVRGTHARVVARHTLAKHLREGDVVGPRAAAADWETTLRSRVRAAREQANAQAGPFSLEPSLGGLTPGGQR